MAADVSLFGACLSIVPFAPQLVAIACADVAKEHQKHAHERLAGLAFALSHPHSRARLEYVEALGLPPLDHDAWRHIETALQSRVPLREVVVHAVRSAKKPRDDITFVALGTTTSITRGTPLRIKPSQYEVVVVELTETETLDVAAWLAASQWVGLVYPGFGLMWAQPESVTTEEIDQWTTTTTPDAIAECAGTGAGAGCSLQSLVCSTHQTTEFVAPSPSSSRPPSTSAVVLTLASRPTQLEELNFGAMHVTSNDLSVILRSCPRLQRLQLNWCVVETLEPLVESYHWSQAARVSSLSLYSPESGHGDNGMTTSVADLLAPVLHALALPATHRMARVLRELEVTLDDEGSVDPTLERLAAVLHTNRVLETVLVRGDTARIARALAPFRDQRLLDVDSDPALLAFVSVMGRHRDADSASADAFVAALSVETLRLIFEFVGSPCVRQVAWSCLPVGEFFD